MFQNVVNWMDVQVVPNDVHLFACEGYVEGKQARKTIFNGCRFPCNKDFGAHTFCHMRVDKTDVYWRVQGIFSHSLMISCTRFGCLKPKQCVGKVQSMKNLDGEAIGTRSEGS